jgi:tetratricopeptide (TPR) repeat protein
MGFALAAGLAGCAALDNLRGEGLGDAPAAGPTPVEQVRAALAAGNASAAEIALAASLTAPTEADAAPDSKPAIRQTPWTTQLLLLRAQLRIGQSRFAEAESDALTAMALAPSTSATGEVLSQRDIHLRMAQLLEDAGRDDGAESHLEAARQLCVADPALGDRGACDTEREALVRIRLARGHYAEAEPLVLAEIADVQSRYGADDIRLAFALCHAARFYARQGKYALSGPLFTRSFDVWKNARDEAFAEHTQALSSGQPSPFDAAFLRPRAGHLPFAEPCGLDEQPALLYKLNRARVVGDAVRFEQVLWADNTEAGIAADAALAGLVARGADSLDIAAAHHAVAFVARKKGDAARAEQELRAAIDAYAARWPSLPVSERRYRAEDYLSALERLVELLRTSRRFAEAVERGAVAAEVAEAVVDRYDSLRLDTLLSQARTFREMKDAVRAETSAGRYLDAIVEARGDTSCDYAWALRTISYAYLLRDELDASQRMEMQAKAIWAKQDTVAPEF